MHNLLEKYLLNDEKILEIFSPDVKRKFISKDGILIPIGVGLCAWAFVTLFGVLNDSNGVSAGSVLWPILFLLVSLYLFIGRFFC